MSICFSELEVRDCAPCDDGGWDVPTEIEHLNEKLHTYTRYDIYQGLRLTLCNYCAVDFESYLPEYFRFKDGRKISLRDFNLVKQIEHPELGRDKFCPGCSQRLNFLKFVAELGRLNEE